MNSKILVDFNEKVGKECMLCFHDGGSIILPKNQTTGQT